MAGNDFGAAQDTGMLCVGCPIGPFHSVTEACRAHELDEQDVITELQAVILEVV